MLMMTFYLHLKGVGKPKHTRLKFNLEKLKDSNVLETFEAMIGEKFAPLTIKSNEDIDIDSMITTFNTAMIETARRSLANIVRKKHTKQQQQQNNNNNNKTKTNKKPCYCRHS